MTVKLIHNGKGRPGTIKKAADLRILKSIPPAPPYFSPDRVAIWREYSGHLIARGDLSEADLGTLENYVMSLADYRDFSARLREDGHVIVNTAGDLRAHPACSLRKAAEMQLNICGAQLGLSPRGRAAMKRESQNDTELPEAAKNIGSF